MKSFALTSAALLLMAAVGVAAEPAASVDIEAYTRPSEDVTLSFAHPGRVSELLVKEGDKVTKDQVIAKQDDSEESAALAIAIAQAKDKTRVEAQEAVRDMKKKTYERKKESGVAGASEIDESLLDWQVGIANVVLSEFEHDQDGRKQDQAKAQEDKTKVKTPIAGVVEQTMIKVGESADQQKLQVARIVNIDPLWIEIPVPFAVARELKEGDATGVKFSNNETRTGKIINVSTVADAASQTLLVRVEVGNAAKTPAGEKVTVSFNRKSAMASTGN